MRILSLALLLALGPAVFGTEGAMRYPIDRNHTTIGFEAPVLGISKVTGKFADFRGAIVVHDPQDLTRSEVEVTIDTASIDTGIDERDQHLRTADFFDAGSHPHVTFISERVEKAGDGYRVIGDLTLRGVTRKISVPFRITHFEVSDVVAAEARFTLDRSAYGVSWSRVMDDGKLFVGNEIEIEIYLLTRVGKPYVPGQELPTGPTNEPDGSRRTEGR